MMQESSGKETGPIRLDKYGVTEKQQMEGAAIAIEPWTAHTTTQALEYYFA